MKVSIIIPFHGGEQFLDDCLRSLSEQAFRDFEVVMVLDGYLGNIDNCLGPYNKSMNIRVFSLEGKTGVAAARNLGLDMAEGEYVYFLDSDDYIFEEAVGTLLTEALESGADIVYGKKNTSYYKREIFLPTYIEKREQRLAELAAMEEGQDDENDNDDEQELTVDELEEHQRTRAVRLLIGRKKRIKNISVLNVLIRRELIEKNGIRFDEKIKYYSDLPFLAEILDTEPRCRKRFAAHYIKRKHSDPINMPSLSQIVDESRFSELISTLNTALDTVREDGIVRSALDRQIVQYYTGYYAPRLRRSVNDFWKNERFEQMSSLAQRLQKANVRKEKRYKRAMIKALVKKDLEKSIKLVNRHLAFKKLIRIIKKKFEFQKYLYKNHFLKKPVQENCILFESFFGKNYSDSPKYIYEYLCKAYPGKYKMVWVLDNKTKLPFGGIKVKRFGIRYMYYLAVSKYFVFNGRQPVWYRKRENTVFLETWHGTPLKKLVFDLEEVYSASPMYKKEVYSQSRKWDYLIAANKFSSDCFKSCFLYTNIMLEYGYPRNDLLHDKNRDEISKRLRKKLGIPEGKKTVLYAPTWRDDEYYGKGSYKFELKLDLRQMQQTLGEDYAVLLRTHYFISDSLDTTGLEGFAYNFSKYDDITELYLISDIIITDYSSVFFDYANLKRPMLFYTYDLDKYRDVLRGFYIDIEEELPGPLLFTTAEVIDAIKNIDSVSEKYAAKYDVFYEKYCGWEDGHAAENVAKRVFNPDGDTPADGT